MINSDYSNRTYFSSASDDKLLVRTKTDKLEPHDDSFSSSKIAGQFRALKLADRILNYFENTGIIDFKGEVLLSSHEPVPLYSSPEIITDFFNRVHNNYNSLFFVLLMIKNEIELQGISQFKFEYQDKLLVNLLYQTGYIESIFSSPHATFPSEENVSLADPNALPVRECIITVNNSKQFNIIKNFLIYQLQIPYKITNDGLTSEFKAAKKESVTLKLVTKEYRPKEALALDIANCMTSPSSPIPLIVRHPNPWEGLILELTQSVQPESWVRYVLQCTEGKRALNINKENNSRKSFLQSLPKTNRGKFCGEFFLQACQTSQIHSGDAFIAAVLQFLISTELDEKDCRVFIEKNLDSVELFSPTKSPILRGLLQSCKNGTSFSIVQSLLKVTAILALLGRSDVYKAEVTRAGGEQAIRLSFKNTDCSILLPYTPSKSLTAFARRHLTSHCPEETEKLFLLLNECLHRPCDDDPLVYSIMSCDHFKESLNKLDSLTDSQDPFLCHLALSLVCAHDSGDKLSVQSEHLARTIVIGLSPPLSQKSSTNLLKSFASSKIPLFSNLADKIGPLFKQSQPPSQEMIRKAVKAFFLNKKHECFLIQDLWLEETINVHELSDIQIKEGLLLLESLLNLQLWSQAFSVLEVISKKSTDHSYEMIEGYIKAYEAISTSSEPAEKKAVTIQLAYQLKHTLQRLRPALTEEPEVPSLFSKVLQELVSLCADDTTSALSCDLLMLGLELDMFNERPAKLKSMGQMVFSAMLRDTKESSILTAGLMQYLVRLNLWESDIDSLLELFQRLTDCLTPDSVPYQALCLRLLDQELLTSSQRNTVADLHKNLVTAILRNAGLTDVRAEEFPEVLFAAFLRTVPEDKKAAEVILTDPSLLHSWIEKPVLLIDTAMTYWKNTYDSDEADQRILKTLYSLAPYSLYTEDQLRLLINKTIQTLQDQPKCDVMKRLLVNQHLRYIKRLIEHHETTLASDFVLELDKWFEGIDWSVSIISILIEEIPPSLPLLNLIFKLSNGRMTEKLALYASQLALKEIDQENTAGCISLAELLTSSYLPTERSGKLARSLKKLILHLLSNSENIFLAEKLAEAYLENSEISDSTTSLMITHIAEKYMEKGEWEKSCLWIAKTRGHIDPNSAKELVLSALDKWIPNSRSGWNLFFSLIQSFPDLNLKKIVPIISKIHSKILKGLEPEIAVTWSKIIKTEGHTKEDLAKGWMVVMKILGSKLPTDLCDEMLSFPIQDVPSYAGEFRVKALQTAFRTFRRITKRPEPDTIDKLLKLYSAIHSDYTVKFRSQIIELLIKANMPDKAMEVFIDRSEEDSIEPALLLKATRALLRSQISVPKKTVRLLEKTATDRSFVYHHEIVNELAHAPHKQTFKLACDLFCRRLDQFEKENYRKIFSAEAKQTMAKLLAEASDNQQLLELERCLNHPFLVKYLNSFELRDDYMHKLLGAAKGSDLEACRKTLDLFVTYSCNTQQETSQYTEKYAQAVSLNLEMLRYSNDTKEFKHYHTKLVNAIALQTNRIKRFQHGKPLTEKNLHVAEMSRDMAFIYMRSLFADEWKPESPSAYIYEQVQSLLTEWFDYENKDIFNIYLSQFQEFFSLTFPNETKQASHLKLCGKFFEKICDKAPDIQPSLVSNLYGTLHKKFLLLLSDPSVEPEPAKQAIISAYTCLTSYTRMFEISMNELQLLFDSYFLNMPEGRSEIIPTLIDAGYHALHKILNLLKNDRDEYGPKETGFYLETELFFTNKFPDIAETGVQNKGLIVERVLQKLRTKSDIYCLLRACKIFQTSLSHLPSHHLEVCGHLLSSWIEEIELDPSSAAVFARFFQRTNMLAAFNSSIAQEQKIDFYEMIFSALLNKCHPGEHSSGAELLEAAIAWLSSGLKNKIEIDSPKGYLSKLESFSPPLETCSNFNIIKLVLNLLKQLPNSEPLEETDQKRRAGLVFRLLNRLFLIDPDRKSPTTRAFYSYFSQQTAIFIGHKTYVQLIKKTLTRK